MAQPVMTAEAVVRILDRLGAHGVAPCLSGGWGVDGLLRQQTRAHADLDLWLAARDLEPLFVAARDLEIDRVLPTPGDRPWNFVLHDGAQLRIDLHLYEPVADDRFQFGACASAEVFPMAALAGQGAIAGRPVRCEAPEWAVRWHSGYRLRPVDRHDVRLLCERFRLPLPASHASAQD